MDKKLESVQHELEEIKEEFAVYKQYSKSKYDELNDRAEYGIRELELRLSITQKQRESLQRDKAALIGSIGAITEMVGTMKADDARLIGIHNALHTILAKMKEPQ